MKTINYSDVPDLAFGTLICNVDTNIYSGILVRDGYVCGNHGVHKTGIVGDGEDGIIAVSGLTSCGGLILYTVNEKKINHYMVIHLGGDVTALLQYQGDIKTWIKDEVPNSETVFALCCTGDSGSSDYIMNSIAKHLQSYSFGSDCTIYKEVGTSGIGITVDLRIGKLTPTIIRPINPPRNRFKDCCNIM